MGYRKFTPKTAQRVELHDAMGLTGCEVSVNSLPAGAAVPFVHRHNGNEELYGFIEGRAQMYLDGEIVDLAAGDWLRVDPEVHRALRASPGEGVRFVCIQTRRGSLGGFTMADAALCEDKAPWLA